MLRGPRGQDKPSSDLNKYLIALHFVHSWGGIKCHNSNKLNNGNGILNIQPNSLFKMQVTMELSRANYRGGRQHDSPPHPTPYKTHTATHTHTTQRINAVASPAMDSSGHSCGKVQWWQGGGGGDWAKRREKREPSRQKEREMWERVLMKRVKNVTWGKLEQCWANSSWKSNTRGGECLRSAATEITLYF